MRGQFLDISKAFDKVWHEDFIHFKPLGYQVNYLRVLGSFLKNRFQRVVLNGQSWDWSPVNAGIPQGSFLGSLLFVININILQKAKFFADDTSLFSTIYDPIQGVN